MSLTLSLSVTEWEAELMWTKRRTIMIAGCSRFGAGLAGEISELGDDVIVIDKHADAVSYTHLSRYNALRTGKCCCGVRLTCGRSGL